MITFQGINFKNFKNIAAKNSAMTNAYGNSNQTQNIYIYDKNVNFSGNNLAPLERDTVSFGSSGRKDKAPTQKLTQEEKDAQVGKVRKDLKPRESKRLNQSDRGSLHVAAAILDDADFAYKRLRNDISSIFGMQVIESDDARFLDKYETELHTNIENKKPVLAIVSRKKSAKSLAEKMGHMQLATKKQAMEEIHDVAGIRILVSNSDKKSGDYVADRLLKAVKNGWIKISEIEVYRNPALSPASKYDYIKESKLDSIAAASRTKVKDFGYTIRQTEFGYSAIHLRVDLPGDVKGEIQIISPKVAAFKDIEDICYKALSGKGLPKGYSKLKAAFDKIDPKINHEGYDEFAEYTRQAYAYERRRPSKEKGPFLSIPEGSKIPPRLDFNYISDLREEVERTKMKKTIQKLHEDAARLAQEISEGN